MIDPIREALRVQLDEFIASGQRSRWLGTPEVKVYVRRSRRAVAGGFFHALDLASINVESSCQGRGIGTTVVALLIEHCPTPCLYAESVINPVMRRILHRAGFVEREDNEHDLYLFVKGERR